MLQREPDPDSRRINPQVVTDTKVDLEEAGEYMHQTDRQADSACSQRVGRQVGEWPQRNALVLEEALDLKRNRFTSSVPVYSAAPVERHAQNQQHGAWADENK